MRIACVYTVEVYFTVEKPLRVATEIPFGISAILTALKEAGHEVDLFVVTPKTMLDEMFVDYIQRDRPAMFCFTAVSTQYWQAKKVSKFVKEISPKLYTVLGGHHASLATQEVIKEEYFDAVCVGEGESAIIELVEELSKNNKHLPRRVNNFCLRDEKSNWHENENDEFRGELDSLPYLDRSVWEEWVAEPANYPAIILGRGCPFKCTYCSNHAMAKLSKGSYVRFRSPQHIVGELNYITSLHPETERVYLEVETFGANRKASYAIFDALAEYNNQRETPIRFGVNLALTTNFMRNDDRIHETLQKAKAANLVTINIGLESGSERMRRLLIRPKYTNEELIKFSKTAREYGIRVVFFVLLGLPEETIKDYMETIRVAREAQPYKCYVSIFYPYLGTDLATHAVRSGLVELSDLSPIAERGHSQLNLPEFSARRIRFEYIMFSWRVYRGHWPYKKVFAAMFGAFLAGHPDLYSTWIKIRNRSNYLRRLTNTYKYKEDQVPQMVGTRVDVQTE
jgi:radical SAM superfamily enzyme YgiQ (UPF0313 family)